MRVGDPLPGDQGPAVQYSLPEHLKSGELTTDEDGHWVDREEYTPFGETSFGSFSRKRYRFSGKERDEESGLYYFGQRYYAPWLGRWVTCDPAGRIDGTNLYQYVRGSPLSLVDPVGRQSQGSASGYKWVTASDYAEAWNAEKAKTEETISEWVQKNPSLLKNIAATTLMTSIDLGGGMVDLINLGQGSAAGGWGYLKDAIRAVGLAAPMLRVFRGFQGMFQEGQVVAVATDEYAFEQARLLDQANVVGRGEVALVTHGSAEGQNLMGMAPEPVQALAPVITASNASRATIVACRVAVSSEAVQELANATEVPVTTFQSGVYVSQTGQFLQGGTAAPAVAQTFRPQFWSTFFTLANIANKGSTVTGTAAGGLAAEGLLNPKPTEQKSP